MDICIACSDSMQADQRAMVLQEVNQILAHIPDSNLDLDYYEMCSQRVVEAIFGRLEEGMENVWLSAIERMASSPLATGLADQMFELYLLSFFLPKGGPVMVGQFDQGEQPVLISSLQS